MSKSLPILDRKPSTAASTAFCHAELLGPGGFVLYVDGNGKITRDNGTLDEPRPNAFSLVQIADCPGSTPTCRAGCYVHGLEQHAKSTHDLYTHNSATIRAILAEDALASEWAMFFAAWLTNNVTSFRWHVSGDVFDDAYAEWIADVCRESPKVEHWIYTRSFAHAAPLVKVSTVFGGNLALNLSCDVDNYAEACAFRDAHIRCIPRAGFDNMGELHALRLCYYTRDGAVPDHLPSDSVIFPDYNLRAAASGGPPWFAGLEGREKKMVCPVDYNGKAENRRCGPCDRCLT